MSAFNIESFGHSRLLKISSEDRDKNVYPNSCDFQIHFQTKHKLHKIRRVIVRTVSFPNAMYNVSSVDGGNILVATGSITGLFQIVVPEGQFDTSSLIAEMETQINLAIAPQTVVLLQDSLTQKVFIQTTGEDLTISGGILADTIGILSEETFLDSVNTSVESIPSLEGLTSAHLHTSFSQSNSIVSNGKDSNILIDIPILVPYGLQNNYIPSDPELASITFHHTQDLSSLHIKLTDEHERILDIHGRPVVIYVKIYYYS